MHNHLIRLACVALVFMASSCERYATDHPDTAALTVVPDWNGCGGAVLENGYGWTVRIGDDYSNVEHGGIHTADRTFAPGDYTVTVYSQNSMDEPLFDIGDGTVNQEIHSGGYEHGLSMYVDGCSHDFYIGSADVSLAADSEQTVSVPMKKITRELDIVLNLPDESDFMLERAEGYLLAAYAEYDIIRGKAGMPTPLRITFVPGQWKAEYHVLGISSGADTILWSFVFSDCSSGEIHKVYVNDNIQFILDDFNFEDNAYPFTLTRTVGAHMGSDGLEVSVR